MMRRSLRLWSCSALAAGVSFLPGRDAPAAPSSDPFASDPAPAAVTMPATAGHVGDRLSALAREQQQVQSRLDGLVDESRTLETLSVVRGRAYVRLARAGLLPVGGGFSDLVDHAARVERLHRALARDIDRQSQIARERLALANRLRLLGERRALLEDEHAALERSHVAIEAAAERELAFQRAFMTDSSSSDHTAVYGSGIGTIGPDDLRGGFESMRGRLSFPILGRTEIVPSTRRGASDRALEMRAAPGVAVHAVYPGRVAFADEYADYGRTVIVDHGSSYFTVTAGLGEVTVRAGDPVGQGDRLGALPTDRASLYFEVRRGGEIIDASVWFGL